MYTLYFFKITSTSPNFASAPWSSSLPSIFLSREQKNSNKNRILSITLLLALNASFTHFICIFLTNSYIRTQSHWLKCNIESINHTDIIMYSVNRRLAANFLFLTDFSTITIFIPSSLTRVLRYELKWSYRISNISKLNHKHDLEKNEERSAAATYVHSCPI